MQVFLGLTFIIVVAQRACDIYWSSAKVVGFAFRFRCILAGRDAHLAFCSHDLLTITCAIRHLLSFLFAFRYSVYDSHFRLMLARDAGSWCRVDIKGLHMQQRLHHIVVY